MGVVEAFSLLLRVDPQVGKVMLAGLAAMAAGAIAVGFGGFGGDALLATIFVVAFGVMVTLLFHVVSSVLMRAVLAWALVLVFLLWLVGFIESALQFTGRLPKTPCYIRMVWELPEACERRLAPVIGTAGSGQASLHPWRPERLWLAQAISEPAAPVVPAPPPEVGRVFLQFGPQVDRATSTEIAKDLAASGWDVPGAALGGEYVRRSPSRNEVRFFHPEDQAAARALAEAAAAANPGAEIAIRDFTRLGGYTPSGQLELWLNQTPMR